MSSFTMCQRHLKTKQPNKIAFICKQLKLFQPRWRRFAIVVTNDASSGYFRSLAVLTVARGNQVLSVAELGILTATSRFWAGRPRPR